jgi:hypothetical protein
MMLTRTLHRKKEVCSLKLVFADQFLNSVVNNKSVELNLSTQEALVSPEHEQEAPRHIDVKH